MFSQQHIGNENSCSVDPQKTYNTHHNNNSSTIPNYVDNSQFPPIQQIWSRPTGLINTENPPQAPPVTSVHHMQHKTMFNSMSGLTIQNCRLPDEYIYHSYDSQQKQLPVMDSYNMQPMNTHISPSNHSNAIPNQYNSAAIPTENVSGIAALNVGRNIDSVLSDDGSQQSTLSNTSRVTEEERNCMTPTFHKIDINHASHPGAHSVAASGETTNSNVTQQGETDCSGNWSQSTSKRQKTSKLNKLYEMNNNAYRKAWLDKLLAFMEERGSPITSCPSVSKNALDLFQLYICVKEKGGYVQVMKDKAWKDIAHMLGVDVSTRIAYTLRKHYIKNLLLYECQFDRGGIDPSVVFNQLKTTPKKNANTSILSSPSSSNSQDSLSSRELESNSLMNYPGQHAYPNNGNPDYSPHVEAQYSQIDSGSHMEDLKNERELRISSSSHSVYPNDMHGPVPLPDDKSQNSLSRKKLQYNNEPIRSFPANIPSQQHQEQRYSVQRLPNQYEKLDHTHPYAPEASHIRMGYHPYSRELPSHLQQLPQNNIMKHQFQEHSNYNNPSEIGKLSDHGNVQRTGINRSSSGMPLQGPRLPGSWYPIRQEHFKYEQNNKSRNSTELLSSSSSIPPHPTMYSGPHSNFTNGQQPYLQYKQGHQPYNIKHNTYQHRNQLMDSSYPPGQCMPQWPKEEIVPMQWEQSANTAGHQPIRLGPLGALTNNKNDFSKLPPSNKTYKHLEGNKDLQMVHQSQENVMQQKQEISFPPESVEATLPIRYTRRRLSPTDCGPIDAWRIIMCLRSGLPAETCYALDVLNVLLFDDKSVYYFALNQWVGLLDLLLEHFGKTLSYMFDCINLNETKINVDLGRIDTVIDPNDKVQVLKQTGNYTFISRTGDYVKIIDGDEDLFIKNEERSWDVNGDATLANKLQEISVHPWERQPNHILPTFHVEIGTDTFNKTQINKFNNSDNSVPASNIEDRFENKSVTFKVSTDANASERSGINETIPKQVYNVQVQCDNVSLNAVEDFNNNSPSKHKTPRIQKHDIISEYVDETVSHKDVCFVSITETQDGMGRKCISLSNILRNLTFIYGNEEEFANNQSFLMLVGKLLLLHHTHPQQSCASNSEQVIEMGTTAGHSEVGKDWWWDYLMQIREDVLVSISNIAGQLDLDRYSEEISRPLLDGLLHWAVCPSSESLDPFQTSGSSSLLSPQRLALESLCKLCVTNTNADLLVATPPFSRLNDLCRILTRYLYKSEDQVLREFSVNLLHYLTMTDSSMARVVALQKPSISLLLTFIEDVLKVDNVDNQYTMVGESSKSSSEVTKRAASTLSFLAEHPDNRSLLKQQENRLLTLITNQYLDSEVSHLLSRVLYNINN